MIFSITGFIFNLAVLGIIVAAVSTFIERQGQQYATLIANGHVTVLGWTDKTLWLLGELAQMLTDTSRGGEIVLLGQCDVDRMSFGLRMAFPEWRTRWPDVKVRIREGDPANGENIMRLSLFASRYVFVLGRGR